ncbi:MAG TPA: hypothetical protein VGB78_02415 [Thermoplasmata archaeon]
MPAGKNPTITVRYPKRWLLVGTAFWVIITPLSAYLAITSIEDFAKAVFWLIAVSEGIFLFLVAFTPLLTNHIAGELGLKLRMGVLVNETIAYSWIAEAKDTSLNWGSVRVGIGVRYSRRPKTLYITSGFDQMVSLRLDSERLIGGVFKKPVSEIVLNVDSARSFIELVAARKGQAPGGG